MSSHLSPDVWAEIFRRLPFKLLFRCICVCKAWKSIITDIVFMYSHASCFNNDNNGTLFLQSHRLHEFKTSSYQKGKFETRVCFAEFHSLYYPGGRSLDFTPPFIHHNEFKMIVVGTCNGLVCFAHKSIRDISVIIMNPSIRKYIETSKPNIPLTYVDPNVGDYSLLGFGFDSRNMDFKVVRIIVCHRTQLLYPQVEIYSYVTEKWRSISDRTPSLYYIPYGLSNRNGQFVNGVLHWIACGSYDFILTFDLVQETFGRLMLPQSWDESSSHERSLLGGSNSLALVLKKNNIFYIWVMREYGDSDSWTLVFSFSSSYFGGILRVKAFISRWEVVLEKYSGKTVMLDLKDDSVKPFGPDKYTVDFVGHYTESFFLAEKENNVVSFKMS